MNDEIKTHLDLLKEEYIARGLSPDEAALAARRAFGGVDQIKESYRDRRGFPMATEIAQDARYAFRLMARERWFTAATVIALSLGIGATTTMVTILYSMNLRGLPFDEATALVEAFLTTPFSGNPRHSRRIEQVAAYEQSRRLPELPA